MSFFENTRKPTGLGGKLMVNMMNLGHRGLADWGTQFLPLEAQDRVLDCGCGGGANLARLVQKCPRGMVYGIDYSEVSVEKSRAVNAQAIGVGKCAVQQASVMELPYGAAEFDVVTAFETVYFWPDLLQSFREVYRVLKPGGTFFICNECSGDTGKEDHWTEKIDGMTIYRDSQLKSILEQAGFREIAVHKNKKGWLCLLVRK